MAPPFNPDDMELTAKVPFDDRHHMEAYVENISPLLVRGFLREIGSQLMEQEKIVNLDLYRKLRLLRQVNSHEVPRNFALLFFNEEPHEFFRQAWIEVAQFPEGPAGDVILERKIHGPLDHQVKLVLSHLQGLSDTLIRKVRGQAKAPHSAAYPFEAVEEIVVNAVHHRGYDAPPDPLKIYLYPERMVVTSYPGPVPSLKLEDFRPGATLPTVTGRNRRIGELLKELELAEVKGTGISKIQGAMRANGSPPAEFDFDEETRTYFSVTLPIHPDHRGSSAVRHGSEEHRVFPGKILGDRYRIVHLLGRGGVGRGGVGRGGVGRGGLGEVYLAEDLFLKRTVALKFLPLSMEDDEETLGRFFDEVRLAQAVTDPNVCRVYDISPMDGHVFISMEYIEGQHLADLNRQIGRLTKRTALEIGRHICSGLDAIHSRDILHKNLKPTNVMIDKDGNVKITDFGITKIGAIQHEPDPVSIKSDLYSLGLVLYELFTGRPAMVARPIPPSRLVEDFDPDVESVILGCLKKNPERRPATAMDVYLALQDASDRERQRTEEYRALLSGPGAKSE